MAIPLKPGMWNLVMRYTKIMPTSSAWNTVYKPTMTNLVIWSDVSWGSVPLPSNTHIPTRVHTHMNLCAYVQSQCPKSVIVSESHLSHTANNKENTKYERTNHTPWSYGKIWYGNAREWSRSYHCVSDVISHSSCFVIAKRHIPLLQSGQKVTSNHCHFILALVAIGLCH
jgi:hypothetical protein